MRELQVIEHPCRSAGFTLQAVAHVVFTIPYIKAPQNCQIEFQAMASVAVQTVFAANPSHSVISLLINLFLKLYFIHFSLRLHCEKEWIRLRRLFQSFSARSKFDLG